MSLFKRKKETIPTEPLSHKVEVAANKSATEEAFQEAKAANDKLNRALVNNGFTFKIYLAAHNPVHIRRHK